MPRAALAGLAALAGWPDSEATAAVFRNADPVLRTRYRVGAAAAASLAAGAIAADRLRAARMDDERQEVEVDLRHAAASLRSSLYLTLDGPKPPAARDTLTGFYPVRDGRWVYLHCNFANHRDGIARLLGTPPEREAMAAATAGWDGAALESALAEAGMPGGLARDAESWQREPQAHALAALPVLEILRIGDAPPERLPAGQRPLAGIRVLDLTRVIAGPVGARTLAAHGAKVLKINAADLPSSGFLEFDTGIGKRSAFLDLRRVPDQSALRRLVAQADVFVQSYRPGALAAKELGPAELAELRPGIVYVTLSAFGHAGPWRDRRGFDSIVQTVSGMALAQARDTRPDSAEPALLPCSAIDYVSGYLMAFGAMVALARRAEEGGSWLVRTSLAQVGRWIGAQGRAPEEALAGVPAEFAAEELGAWLARAETPLGPLAYLAPAVRMSATPARWDLPPVPLGTHKPEWW
jgi:crotonobetainyl-CoA:carnitine CoA-transferase CaiB-like acyl-CoA transferase